MAQHEYTEPQTRILLATIGCIERDGLDRLTTRTIATEAGVNIAAINYYFRSKEALVGQALELTLRNGLDVPIEELRAAMAGAPDPLTGARRFLTGFLHAAVRYPRLTHAHLRDALAFGDYTGAALPRMHRLLEAMLEAFSPILPPGDEAERRRSIAQLWSALLLGIVAPGLFAGFGVDLRDDAAVDGYVARLCAQFFTAPAP